jgi:hypothetical protein
MGIKMIFVLFCIRKIKEIHLNGFFCRLFMSSEEEDESIIGTKE